MVIWKKDDEENGKSDDINPDEDSDSDNHQGKKTPSMVKVVMKLMTKMMIIMSPTMAI